MLRVSVDTGKKNEKILEPKQKLDPVTLLIRIREFTATILIRLDVKLLVSAIRLYDHLADINTHPLRRLELQKTA
jgi:hypothetical protein